MHLIPLALGTLKRELQPAGRENPVGVQPSGCPSISPAKNSSAQLSSEKMKTSNLILVLAAWALLAGCVSTRPISDSGYREPGAAGRTVPEGQSDLALAYRAELS